MFGSRKHRPPNPPLNASTANPSAASAALSAFTGHRRKSSSSSLSAAAAAAALRARPPTPTNVADVQTKRTIRRSASIEQPTLKRQASSGSMSERTFRRSPSPGNTGATTTTTSNTRGSHQRSLSAGGTPRYNIMSASDDAPPPVPAIPDSVNQAAARARTATKPKTLAFVSTPVRTASQKMAAAQQQQQRDNRGKEAARGSWFGAATVGDVRNVRTSDAAMATPKVARPQVQVQVPQQQQQQRSSQETVERPESRGSPVNFSYPGRARVASPTGAASPTVEVEEDQPRPQKRSSTMSPQRGGSVRSSRPSSVVSDQTLVYDPNSRRMVPRSNLTAVQQQVQTASEKKPKKKKTATPNRAGSHLSKGTMGRTKGTAVDAEVPSEAQTAAAASLRSHRNEERQGIALEPDTVYEPSAPETVPELVQPEPLSEPHNPNQPPKISSSPASNAPEVLGSPLREKYDSGLQRRPSVVREEDEEESEPDTSYEASTATGPEAVPARQSVYAHGMPSPPQSEDTDDLPPMEASRVGPAELAAPLRPTAEPRETQAIRGGASRTHSNSPVRSARFAPVQQTLTVKHEPPARSLSPRKSALKQSSPPRGMSPTGDVSDASGVTPILEPPPQRKKSVRVSFDDENTVVVGEAAGRSEAESPVPPSPQQAPGRRSWYNTLGIGRKKDAVPLEEDEVMQPRPALPSFGSVRGRKQSPKPAEERPLIRPSEHGQSTDQALGAAIIAEQQGVGGGGKTGANISKIREPLPPVVTSVEGSGYMSDTASSDDDAVLLADTPKLEAEESTVSQASTLVPEAPKAQQDAGIPSISVTQPSPNPGQKREKRSSAVYFPGAFPDTETETDNETGQALATQSTVQEPTDTSDGDSVYSDAYEDLPEVEGDGFQSLDAVLGTPVVATPPVNVLQKAQEQREAVVTTPTPQSREEEYGDDVPTPKASENPPVDPWAAAKAYWRSLTADKRAQLEREASEEAGVEADLEEAQPEVKKPRRKKSMEQRHAEKKVIEEQRAASDLNSRSYMIKPGTKAKTIDFGTSSASTKPEGAMRLRKTMRGAATQPVEAADTNTHMRKTLRSAAPERPKSDVTMGVSTSITSGGRARAASESTTSQSLANVLAPNLRRRGSDSSTSSFKRARPSASTGMGFRKTMRTGGGSLDLSSAEQPSSRFSLRSMSPPVSVTSRSMRTTLRGENSNHKNNNNNKNAPSMTMRRHSEDSGSRGYLRFSGGGFARPADKRKGKLVSRFGDDSSSDDGAAAAASSRFRSRFEDSSDEDEAVAAASAPRPAGQSILKTIRGGNSKGRAPPSPPLPEEEELSDIEEGGGAGGDDEKTPGVTFDDEPMTATSTTAGGTSRNRASGGMEGRRRSMMSAVLLRRNKKHDSGGKIARGEVMDSAARRDSHLNNKRMTVDEEWPLSKHVTETVGGKEAEQDDMSSSARRSSPNSNGVLGHSRSQPTMRPSSAMMRRTLSSMSGQQQYEKQGQQEEEQVVDEDGMVVPARRKKKFGVLRRMFRLDE